MKVTFPKGFFMRTIVLFCIGYIVFLTERSMAINQAVGASADGIYDVAVKFFGFELLMTMAKTIADIVKSGAKDKKSEKKEEEE